MLSNERLPTSQTGAEVVRTHCTIWEKQKKIKPFGISLFGFEIRFFKNLREKKMAKGQASF